MPESVIYRKKNEKKTTKKWVFRNFVWNFLIFIPNPILISSEMSSNNYQEIFENFPNLLRFSNLYASLPEIPLESYKKILSISSESNMKKNRKKIFVIKFINLFKKKKKNIIFIDRNRITKKKKNFQFFPKCSHEFFPLGENLWDNQKKIDCFNQFNFNEFTKVKLFDNMIYLVTKLKRIMDNQTLFKNKKFPKIFWHFFEEKMKLKKTLFFYLLNTKYEKNFLFDLPNKTTKKFCIISQFSFQKIIIIYCKLYGNKGYKKLYGKKTQNRFKYGSDYSILKQKNLKTFYSVSNLKITKERYIYSKKIFRNFFSHTRKGCIDLFLLKISTNFTEKIRKIFFSKQKYKISIMIEKKFKKKRDNVKIKKKFLKFLLLKTESQKYIFSDEDFVFGFVINFCKNGKWNLASIGGFFCMEKLRYKEENFLEKKKNINFKIIFLIVKDLIIFSLIEKNSKKIFSETEVSKNFVESIPKLLYFKKFKFLQDETKKKEICKNLQNFFKMLKSLIKNLWYNNNIFFLWNLPSFKLWNVRKSDYFKLKLIKFNFCTGILSREINKQISFQKKENIVLFKFKKRKKRSERQKIIRKKKFEQKKINDFYKKINSIVASKKKIDKLNEIFFNKNRIYESFLGNNINEIFTKSHLPLIELKIRKLESFKKKTFMFSKEIFKLTNPKNMSKCWSTPIQVIKKKKFLSKKQKLFLKNSIFLRIGFVFLNNNQTTLFFLGFKFIFCFIFFIEESILFKVKFNLEKNKNLLSKKISILRLKKLEFSNFKRCENKKNNLLIFFSFSKFRKKKIKKIKKIFVAVTQKLFETYKNFFFLQSIFFSSGKEKSSPENFLFYLKNEKKLIFNHFLNYIFYGIDYYKKFFFTNYYYFYKIVFYKIFWENILARLFFRKKKKNKCLGKFFFLIINNVIFRIVVHR